jgi:hypothetical protein
MQLTMASLTVVNDITKPFETSNLFPKYDNNKAMTKAKREVLKTIGKMAYNQA